MTVGMRGSGSCCSLLKSTVKIFDIYTEESEYIQAAKGEEDDLSPVRGTFGTANTQPIPARSPFQSRFIPLSSVPSSGYNQQDKLNPDVCGSACHLCSYYSFMWYSGVWSGKRWSVGPADLSCDCRFDRTGSRQIQSSPCPFPPLQSAGVFGSKGTYVCISPQKPSCVWFFIISFDIKTPAVCRPPGF